MKEASAHSSFYLYTEIVVIYGTKEVNYFNVIYFRSAFLKERLMYFLNKLFVKQVKSFCLLLD